MNRLVRPLAWPVLLFLLGTGLYWKITLTSGQFTWMNSPDLSSQVLPWLDFQAREWNRGHFPLWDPYNWGGQSLVGRTEPGVMYPLNWLLFLMPLENGHISMFWLDWYYVFTHFLGALFAYLLCRDLGRSKPASLLGGALFGYGGFVGSTGWPQMVNGVVWAPLMLLFLLRAMRGRRPLASMSFAGAALGVSLLSGHHQAPTFMALLAAGLILFHFFADRPPLGRFLLTVGLFGAFAFALGAAQLLPSLEYGLNSVRWVGAPNDPVGFNDKTPYSVHTFFSMPPASILGVVIPGMHIHANPYLGLTAVALACIALLGWKGHREIRLLVGIAASGVAFALGGQSVFHGIIYSLVPMVEKARNPSMSIFVFGLAVAALAAYGLDMLTSNRALTAPVARKAGIGLWTLTGSLCLLLLGFFVVKREMAFYDWRPAAAALAAFVCGALMLAWWKGAIAAGTMRVAVILLAIFELGNIAGFEFIHKEKGWRYLEQYGEHASVADFLKKQSGTFRVSLDQDLIPYNFGAWHRVEDTGGNSGITANIFRAHGERNTRMMLGERYTVGRKPVWEGAEEVFHSSGDLKIYRNPEAMPRVWSVHELKSIASRKQVVPELVRPLDELKRRSFLIGHTPELESCSGDDVRLTGRGFNHVVISANMACRGMVILADTYYPGWVATVDGKPAKILEAYGFLRGVVVDGGDRRLEMQFRPASVYVGAAFTAGGMIALALLAAYTGIRRRNAPLHGPAASES